MTQAPAPARILALGEALILFAAAPAATLKDLHPAWRVKRENMAGWKRLNAEDYDVSNPTVA